MVRQEKLGTFMPGLKQMVRHPVRKKRLEGWDWIIRCVASSTDLKVWSAAARIDGKSSAYSEIDLPQFPHSSRQGSGYKESNKLEASPETRLQTLILQRIFSLPPKAGHIMSRKTRNQASGPQKGLELSPGSWNGLGSPMARQLMGLYQGKYII